MTLWLDGELRQGRAGRVLAAAALLIAVDVAAIANIDRSSHPFKRAAVIPYQGILDFIAANSSGRVLVLSTDPVLPWVLDRRGGAVCTGEFLAARRCLDAGAHYDSVFVIAGHNDKSGNAAAMARFDALAAAAIAGHAKAATLTAGRDADAALKSRLTGVRLDEAILTVDLYR
jgi:hypothetical protein